MDLSLVERENVLLGQDFLTWLWYKTDNDNVLFQLEDKRTFSLQMEQKVSVQGGDGEGVETATVSSPRGELTEAKTGLRTGKKVNKAQLLFTMDQDEWLMQVNSKDFGLSGLKTPKIRQKTMTETTRIQKSSKKCSFWNAASKCLTSSSRSSSTSA